MIDTALIKRQAQFSVKCDTEQPLINNENGETLLQKGKSYSQTFTVNTEASVDQIKATINAVMSLSVGVHEFAAGTDISGAVNKTKKIVSTYNMIQV